MNLTKFFSKYIFEIFSIILIICSFDQLYMMQEYNNISKETFVFTVAATVLSIYFGFYYNNEKS